MNKVIKFAGAQVFSQGKLSQSEDSFWLDGKMVDKPSGEVVEVNAKGCWLLPALTALGVDFCEPARDDIYTLKAGFEAMYRGGFYSALLESCYNPIDSIQRLKAIQSECEKSKLDIRHLAAISLNYDHQNLSEMLELSQGGAVGFGDGGELPADLLFLRRAFDYGSMTQKRFFMQPQEYSLSSKGYVHEGSIADGMGMRAIPKIAETIAVYELIELARNTNCPLHLKQITCAESVDLIKQAQKAGLDVTCDVSVYHLLFDHQILRKLDTNAFVLPPFRESSDKAALWEGLNQGVIQAISLAHKPVLEQDKLTNYESAVPGAISLEIAFSALWERAELYLKDPLADLLKLLTIGPNKVMAMEDSKLNWFLFNPEATVDLTKCFFAGQVCNSPLLRQEINGVVQGTMFNGQWRNAQ